MTKEAFELRLAEKVKEAERILEEYLPGEEGFQKTVLQAMNYSVRAGGKRLRPILLLETNAMLGGEARLAEPFAAALELIHTYSLVHDDLPAMDNDSYRRGRETTWKVYGEAMGILAGDGLLNYAFEVTQAAFDRCMEAEELRRCVRALGILAKNAGWQGMLGGQGVDVEAEKLERALTEEEILFVHAHKTSALICSALCIGGALAGASEEVLGRLDRIGRNVGLAFQIRDDMLDVIGDTQELGKQVGSDAANHKQTYVTLHGLEASGREVERLSREATELLASLPGSHDFIEALILSLIDRRK